MPIASFPLPAHPVTRGPRHHFFGYYDKSPWDTAMRRMLALETTFMDRSPTGKDPALVGVIDLEHNREFTPVAESYAWHWQQGNMLRWLPGSDDREIIFNDLREGQFVAVVLDLATGRERVLPRPVYALTPDGRGAVTVNFTRLHHFYAGYGYPGGPDDGQLDNPAPEDEGVWWLDLETGESRLVVSLAELAAYRPHSRMAGRPRYLNHLLFNPGGTRFIMLDRWMVGPGHLTRLYTASPDGPDLCLLADDDLVSHFDWYDSEHVLAWASVPGKGEHFFLFRDLSDEVKVVGSDVLTQDGHCSYSPDRQWLLTDTYPDREKMCTLILYHPATNRRFDLGRFYAPPQLADELRCDLHPRWSPDGRQVCFDSAHEGTRQMYLVEVGALLDSAV